MSYILLLLVLFISISLLYYSFRTGISPMPTSPQEKEALLSLLPPMDGTILELGSGWGTLAFALAKQYPHCQVIGYEISIVPWAYCQIKKNLFGPKNVLFKREDFLKEPLPQAALVVCYLFPLAMKKLSPILQKNQPKGSYLVSNSFSMMGWKPIQIKEIGDLHRSKIFLYQFPVEMIHKDSTTSDLDKDNSKS